MVAAQSTPIGSIFVYRQVDMALSFPWQVPFAADHAWAVRRGPSEYNSSLGQELANPLCQPHSPKVAVVAFITSNIDYAKRTQKSTHFFIFVKKFLPKNVKEAKQTCKNACAGSISPGMTKMLTF